MKMIMIFCLIIFHHWIIWTHLHLKTSGKKLNGKWSTELKHEKNTKKETKYLYSKRSKKRAHANTQGSNRQIRNWLVKKSALFLFLAHRKKHLNMVKQSKWINVKCKNESIERERDMYTREKMCAAIISRYFFHIRKNKNQIASILHEQRQQQNGAKKNQKNNLSICTLYGIQCTRINVIPTNKMQNSFVQMNYNKTTSIPAEKSAANNI